MTRTLPLAILCAMSGALVGALVAWLVLSGTARAGGLTSAVPSGRPYVEDAGTEPETTQAGSYGPVTLSGTERQSEAVGAVSDRQQLGSLPGLGGNSGSPAPLIGAAPVQLDDGGGVSSASLGLASWYDNGKGLYAAVPGWHWGDAHYRLRVCHEGRCVTVTVRDFCGCPGNRLIDLSKEAFRRLAPLSRGLIVVSVTGGSKAGPLPATDTSPTSPLHLPATR